jgi:hypothetical protein
MSEVLLEDMGMEDTLEVGTEVQATQQVGNKRVADNKPEVVAIDCMDCNDLFGIGL